MSAYKTEVIIIGTGSINSNATSPQITSSNVAITTWSSAVTYALGNLVEYSGGVYRSLQNANTNNTPAPGSSFWETALVTVKDGDIVLVTNGASSDILIRNNGLWVSLANIPATVALVDGQIAPAAAITYNAATLPYAKIEYTIRRGSGHGRKREGTYYIINDGATGIQFRHAFSTIGSDVQAPFTPVISGGNIMINYTSVSEGNAIELKYTLRGWA